MPMAIVDVWAIAYDLATDQFDPESRYYGDVSTWYRLSEGASGENTWTEAEKRKTKDYLERKEAGEGNPETLRRSFKAGIQGKGLAGSKLVQSSSASSTTDDKTLLYVAGAALAIAAVAYIARR